MSTRNENVFKVNSNELWLGVVVTNLKSTILYNWEGKYLVVDLFSTRNVSHLSLKWRKFKTVINHWYVDKSRTWLSFRKSTQWRNRGSLFRYTVKCFYLLVFSFNRLFLLSRCFFFFFLSLSWPSFQT